MFNETRPALQIPRTLVEYVLTIASFVLWLAMIVYISTQWPALPDRIPTHFNFQGEADGWGGKGMVWTLPGIGIVLLIGLTIIERFPHAYNYLVPITEATAKAQYQNARLMMVVIKFEIIGLFAYFSWQSIQLAFGRNVGLGNWELPVVLIMIFGTCILFVVRSFRMNKRSQHE
ncbi:DUF1648 domain-containing protein [Priestia koreensis]|uniref:DUF1648 domain-containing protein n=1 Tax=Priestia koreensis TaxID=284581 RepID=A0A0M0L9X7_9BACI|nr:DUF1648 domain-containing protein [Priestia koreensis]KOO47652.1 hypothetical protein AMD01_06355 [Priestia koreensis]